MSLPRRKASNHRQQTTGYLCQKVYNSIFILPGTVIHVPSILPSRTVSACCPALPLATSRNCTTSREDFTDRQSIVRLTWCSLFSPSANCSPYFLLGQSVLAVRHFPLQLRGTVLHLERTSPTVSPSYD